ncbi:hypothetical protein OsI_25943 [Oryza sativa Indica Group]|uniref:Uncharacterized protein n=1 Tax=Oryza sativa subsp. indica TaxID=39946 RepID=A2YL53_ORYSI|nr:hypothetical protein OsI_25943 [Oryza sativa Indica Group]
MSLSSTQRYKNESPVEGISVVSRGRRGASGAPDLAPRLSSNQGESGGQVTTAKTQLPLKRPQSSLPPLRKMKMTMTTPHR